MAAFERQARTAIETMTRDEAALAVARAQAQVCDLKAEIADVARTLKGVCDAVDAKETAFEAAQRHIYAEFRKVQDQLKAYAEDERTRVAALKSAEEELERERVAHGATKARLAATESDLDTERAEHCTAIARLEEAAVQRAATTAALEQELDRVREARLEAAGEALDRERAEHRATQADLAASRALEKILPRWRASLPPELSGEVADEFVVRHQRRLELVVSEFLSEPGRADNAVAGPSTLRFVPPPLGARAPARPTSTGWPKAPEEVEPWSFRSRTCKRLEEAGIRRAEALTIALDLLIEKIGPFAAADVLYWRRVVAGEVPSPMRARPPTFEEKTTLVHRLGGHTQEHLASACARTGSDPRVVAARLTEPLVHLRLIARRTHSPMPSLLGLITHPGETSLFTVACFALAVEQDRVLVELMSRPRRR